MKEELDSHADTLRRKRKWRKKKPAWASGYESGEWQFMPVGRPDQEHESHEPRAMPMLRHISGLVMMYDPQLQSWIATEDSCDTWADWEMARGVVTTRKFTQRLMRLSVQAAQFARRHGRQMPRGMSGKMNRGARPGG